MPLELDLPILPNDADENLPKDDSKPVEPPKKKLCAVNALTAIDDLFGNVFVTRVDPPKSYLDKVQLVELSSYKSENSIPMSSDPLLWWKEHQCSYPILSNIAKYFLAIPATSVASERVFSAAGDIVNAQRAVLSPENVDLLIFLKCNIVIPDDLLR